MAFKPSQKKDLTPQQLCLRYAGYARDYAKAAMALDRVEFFAVRYYLFGHAFELILKSFLLSRGADEKLLRKISHSLTGVHREVLAFGYRATDDRLADLIRWLDPFHEHQEFRYGGREGLVVMPDHKDAFEIFERTHEDIMPLAKAFYSIP